MFVLSAGNTFQ
ncbi:unnamed protein product [Staurois parvus]|uniref:Uncharacterized protein n=1 Tax=Staurois parvus TaxID=386267 RepID=A0ABN9HL67_9NEOB|nr:unnamed protein product [Staurois parvus]